MAIRKITSALILVLGAAATLLAGGPSDEIPFKRHTLDLGRNETCAVADLNGDGRLDIISGENWYEAPGWTKHRFRSFPNFRNYIDNFSDLPIDVNGDGAVDLVSVSWNARRMVWFENPGKGMGAWKERPIDSGAPVEFAFLVDIDGDGKAQELLPQFGATDLKPTTWYEVEGKGAAAKWVGHPVSNKSYGHGIGSGDVNGDGRIDILTPVGWLEAPANPRAGDWKFHDEWNEDRLGFIFVDDVDDDGLNDVVSSNGHGYGVFWLRQEKAAGGRTWKKELIDDAWSQAHAMTMADLNGDGEPELITGKRLYAHNGHDEGGREPLGLYWYEKVRDSDGKIEWTRHIIDYGGRVGGGLQIPVVDVDGDGDLDIAVGGKGGVFLFENVTKVK